LSLGRFVFSWTILHVSRRVRYAPWPRQRSGVRAADGVASRIYRGRLIELRTIPDHAQALEAAGLSE
jgi:hypothetical protein